MNIQTIRNVSDCVPLFLPHSLYLKPTARINISVSLPPAVVGKNISNWDVMEKLRSMIEPETFSVLKVSKSTLEFIRLEAEVEDRAKLKNVLARLDGRMIKLANFSENVRVRGSEAKDDFPTRHDWDTFFRDARNMDEMKAGERPDTIHISNLPITWFCPRHMENTDNPKPSENIFKRIFEKFGEVRCVDIPICDPYRTKMKAHLTGAQTFSFDNEVYFEGYVQFSEYLSFVKTMDEFRGMKLVRKDGDKNLAVNIVVEFDKTKHLSDTSLKKRRIIRERLIAKERADEEENKKKQKALEQKKEREKQREEERKRIEMEKQKEREERRKEKHLKKLREKEEVELNAKIRAEEKKLLETQRKLESIRLLDALFERIKLKSSEMVELKKEEEKGSSKKKEKSKKLENLPENDLRKKLVSRYKNTHEEELEKRREKLKKVRDDVILQDLLVKGRSRSPSIDTISSNDSVFSESSAKSASKRKKKKAKKTRKSSSSEESEKAKKTVQPPAFPVVYNPETGEYIPMGMYPYAGFFPPALAPGLPSSYFGGMDGMKPYRGGGGGYSRFPRGRGRSSYRGGRGYGGYRGYDYGDDYRHRRTEHDDRRSRSYSRSRSRSKSKTRRRRSRSRSRSRERSREKSRERSRSRSRSKSRSRNKNRRLASTRRSRDRSSSSMSRWSSRSRSRGRHRSRRTWSRSRSRSESRGKSKSRSNSRSRRVKSRSRSRSRRKNTPPPVKLQTEKLVKSAKEIQRNVAEKLQERLREEEEMKKNLLEMERVEKEREFRARVETANKRRSNSAASPNDNSNLISTSPKQLSLSPEEQKSPQ
ncbi:A-kinase anchor protein 17A [Phlebotomus argentipes]|uniref:A-kinase anchor protein 17A n=1 Tax=Phlebotomus argentipes TaxID=94469 RepID=UPI002893096C|nr:A-kinase anchor protein 17A [Phlebotomus argentipes]